MKTKLGYLPEKIVTYKDAKLQWVAPPWALVGWWVMVGQMTRMLCGVGGVMVLVSVPLLLRLVPMNRYYGIRVRKAFVCEQSWYELNAYGGKLFLILGLCLLVVGFFAEDLAPLADSPWAPVVMLLPVLGMVPVLVLIQIYSRRFPDR